MSNHIHYNVTECNKFTIEQSCRIAQSEDWMTWESHCRVIARYINLYIWIWLLAMQWLFQIYNKTRHCYISNYFSLAWSSTSHLYVNACNIYTHLCLRPSTCLHLKDIILYFCLSLCKTLWWIWLCLFHQVIGLQCCIISSAYFQVSSSRVMTNLSKSHVPFLSGFQGHDLLQY